MRCKKLFAVLTLLCFMLTLLPAPVFAATTVASGRCGDTATWTLDSDGVLTISGNGEAEWKSSQSWDKYSEAIKSVVVKDGITTLGDELFCDLENAKSITLPDTLQFIEEGAFCYSGFTSIEIPKSVKKIGEYCFGGCDNLREITVAAENTVYTAVDGVLFSKDKKTLLLYPCNKTTVDYSIPEGTITVMRDAFSEAQFRTLTIASTVTVLNSMPTVQAFIVNENNQTYTAVDGVLYNKNKTALECYPRFKTDTVFAIPESVRTVNNIISNCLTKIVVPKDTIKLNINVGESLEMIEVDKDNPNYTSENGVL